jgi:superfamily II RNA helicase
MRVTQLWLPPSTQVHYLGDPGRGSVWEETIINCPPHIRLLAMSATIANAHDLGGWISQARQRALLAGAAAQCWAC